MLGVLGLGSIGTGMSLEARWSMFLLFRHLGLSLLRVRLFLLAFYIVNVPALCFRLVCVNVTIMCVNLCVFATICVFRFKVVGLV